MARGNLYTMVAVFVFMAVEAAAQPKISGAALNGPGRGRSVLESIVQGSALSPMDAGLPYVPMRLRDVRFGRIVASARTDKTGMFQFRGVRPGNYVVELLDNDRG